MTPPFFGSDAAVEDQDKGRCPVAVGAGVHMPFPVGVVAVSDGTDSAGFADDDLIAGDVIKRAVAEAKSLTDLSVDIVIFSQLMTGTNIVGKLSIIGCNAGDIGNRAMRAGSFNMGLDTEEYGKNGNA